MLDNEVLIVGAGPTGLSLALFLAKSGIKARIIDKNFGPGLQSRAMIVHARTLEFYRQLGFADQVVGSGIEIKAINMWVRGEQSAQVDIDNLGGNLSPYPFLLSYPQDEHEKLLVEQLNNYGIRVEWSTTLAGFEQIGDSIHATITKEGGYQEETTVSYLCGCDGAHSKVRSELRLDFGGGTYDQVYYVADVQAVGGASETSGLNFCVKGENFLLLLPIRSTGNHRLIGIIPEALDDIPDVSFENLRTYAEEAGHLHVEKVNWFSTYRVHHRVTDHFKVGRAFLLGDAGHIHSPAGGQGMNTGIGDAVNLSWKLAEVIQGRANRSILDTYEPERITFAHSLLATTDRVFALMNGADIGHQFFRETIFPYLMPFALGFSNIKTAAFKLVYQTRINYNFSHLSVGSVGDIQAGDRLPWVKFADGSDNFLPLMSFDWQIHVYGEVSSDFRSAANQLNIPLFDFEWTDAVAEAGLTEGAIYVMRPDGYIGHIEISQDIKSVDNYMKRFNIVSGKPSNYESPKPPTLPKDTGRGQEEQVGQYVEYPTPGDTAPPWLERTMI